MMVKARWVVVGFAAATLWAGCLGDIGEGGPQSSGGPGSSSSGNNTTGVPGAVVMHRLNHTEYRNTIRTLLETTQDPTEDFPADDVSFGFDNISSVLTMSPVLFEFYENAASALAEEALALPSSAINQRFEAETLSATVGQESGDAWLLWSNGNVSTSVDATTAGDYTITARVWATQAGPDVARAAILIDGNQAASFDVPNGQNDPLIITHTQALTPGLHTIAVSFLNDFVDQGTGDDRNLWVDYIDFAGDNVVGNNPLRDRLVSCDVTDPVCAESTIKAFASQAWRRPATDADATALMSLYTLALGEGDTANFGVELMVRAVLLSPRFLFRPELADDPTSTESQPLDGYALASRLSYFMWSDMPDTGLFAAADGLTGDAAIEAQIDRMLADDKADALVANFAGQWLLFRAIENHQPDYASFPAFDDGLRASMKEETKQYFREFVRGDIPLSKLLSADFTYVNDRLAEHYGLTVPGSADLVRLDTSGDATRLGLLTQGSILMMSSLPTRTSPTRRGKWIMENLLCDEPDPPPPGVESFPVPAGPDETVAERLARHAGDPACQACHTTIDGIGLMFESYDGIGAFRTAENGKTIELDGNYYGEGVTDLKDLATRIEQDPRFAHCMAEKMFIYGLGRGPEKGDEPHLEQIAHDFAEAGFRMPDLIKVIATSEPFKTRRGVKEEE